MKARSAARKHRGRRQGSPRASRSTGARTRDVILAAARTVLLESGFERFTTRKVARAAGITLGNLTYHFPSKRQLLASLIRGVLAEYSAAIEGFFADLSVPLDGKFKALIEWLMDDAATQDANRIFREMWALALHDRSIASAIDDFYDEAIGRIAQLLCAHNPGLKPKAAMAVAHLLAVISEGTGVIYGTRMSRAASHSQVQALAVEVLTAAARNSKQVS